jgi:hypothetical protein
MGTYESYETELNQHKIQIFPNPTDGDLKVNIECLERIQRSRSRFCIFQIYQKHPQPPLVRGGVLEKSPSYKRGLGGV